MHHNLDVHPIPREKTPMFINEPWLIDETLLEYPTDQKQPDPARDNIRVYIPMDLNKDAILRRLDAVIYQFGEANERNESSFGIAVDEIIAQVEIYDQIWYVREMPAEGDHSLKAIELIKEFIQKLEEIPDGCAELFPFQTIDELKAEFLGIE